MHFLLILLLFLVAARFHEHETLGIIHFIARAILLIFIVVIALAGLLLIAALMHPV